MASEQFSLCWDNFHKNMSSGMNSLLESEDLVDVTLAVEGKYLKAHKMVLSVCSPYFKELFKTNPCKHPIVFMKDVSYVALSDLLQFMYQGEVQVSQENLTTFIKTAEALQIKGLTGDGNGATENEIDHERSVQQLVDDYKPEYKTTTVPRPKKLPAPAAPAPAPKRQRLSTSSDVTPAPTIVTKTEPVSNLTGEVVQFKMEPYDQSQSINIQDDDEQFGGESLDDTVGDDTEDYSMMEGNEEEPQAGTSAEGSGEGQDIQGNQELFSDNSNIDSAHRATCEADRCQNETFSTCHRCMKFLCFQHFDKCDDSCSNHGDIAENIKEEFDAENIFIKTEDFIVDDEDLDQKDDSKRKDMKNRRHRTKQFTPARKLGSRCDEIFCAKLGRQCKLISDEAREEILKEFNALGDVDSQRDFVIRHIRTSSTKHTTRILHGISRRQKTHWYHFHVNGEQIPVCKKLFLNTLGISDRMVRTALMRASGVGLLEQAKKEGR